MFGLIVSILVFCSLSSILHGQNGKTEKLTLKKGTRGSTEFQGTDEYGWTLSKMSEPEFRKMIKNILRRAWKKHRRH